MTKNKSSYWQEVNGILVLDKPQGLTSNSALQRIRHLLRAAKAGHTGALDPLATGVLPLCFGEGTKFSQMLLDSDKTYITEATLGVITDTGDAEGTILKVASVPELTDEMVESVLQKFRGLIEQTPPKYSALKIDGQPVYKLAREGKEVDMSSKRREVTIHKLELLGRTSTTLRLEVCCSKGTYIRSLVEDIGEILGCGAHVSVLRRTQAGPYRLDQAHTLEQCQDMANPDAGANPLKAHLLAVDTAVLHLDKVELSALQAGKITNGQSVELNSGDGEGLVRIYREDQIFLGLADIEANGLLKARRLLKTS
ncbi:tRNA pseudouridine(55) synthase TruB [Pokkaliibacter sp. CJK22405]|uniref:tRNA pseudouridine(55) synthase TruB n=1 Tax=Pokkaliibacter sp. CJK22405 TaxID=3384615 RepID=UPI003985619E